VQRSGRAQLQRLSAITIAAGLLSLAAQVMFSDGAQPRLVPLPIGSVPVLAGMILLPLGIGLGLLVGSGRYRAAMLLAVLSSVIALGAIQVPFRTPGLADRILVAATLVGAIAILTAVSALRQTPRRPTG